MMAAKARIAQFATRYTGRGDRRASEIFREAAVHRRNATAFDGLTPYSLALASIDTANRTTPRLNLILPEFSTAAIFAGIRTALEFGVRLADRLGWEMRIVALRGTIDRSSNRAATELIRRDFGLDFERRLTVLASTSLAGMQVGSDDVWVGTHWETAHALDIATRMGLLEPRRIVYLVQDYEPGFMAWSSGFALARATYHAGFVTVVNSKPLANYLEKAEGIAVDERRVFRPHLDLERLRAAAAARGVSSPDSPHLLFYARPNKPRNLFSIGMSALQLALSELGAQGIHPRVSSIGDRHPPPARGPLHGMEILGKVAWADYFERLADSDVMLSLQHSPHPSHPPLDAVVAGGLAVTNELGGERQKLHPRLFAVEPDPRALATAISDAVRMNTDLGRADRYSPELVLGLGVPLSDAVQDVASQYQREGAR